MNREKALEGARKALSYCLALDMGDDFTLFWDETTREVADLILEAAKELSLEIHSIGIPLDFQMQFSGQDELPMEQLRALSCARGILTCLSTHPGSTPYRARVVECGTSDGARLGHIPGATVALFEHAANIDYELAESRCDDLALALTLGQTARIRSYLLDATGEPQDEFDLDIRIGGLVRPPISSTGRIELGTWGNLPGGETFIAPIEGTASGSFVLNGAFKDFVLTPPQALVLRIASGRLVSVEGDAGSRQRLDQLLDHARKKGDRNYDVVAELGIGVNEGITRLTGIALFDEKMLGTTHIALGDNERYGGENASSIHEDLITVKPSVWIDKKLILSSGALSFSAEQWRESIPSDPIPSLSPDAHNELARTAIHAEPLADGRLSVRREVTAGRVCRYSVGQPETSVLLVKVYEHVPALPDSIGFSEFRAAVAKKIALSAIELGEALFVLQRHGLVTIRERHDQ